MLNLQNLLDKYQIKANVNMILDIWSESHRYYHNQNHLIDLLEQINESYFNGEVTEKERELLYLTSLFHQIVFEVNREDNEEKSAEFLINLCEDKVHKDIELIQQAIVDSKEGVSNSIISEKFNKFDRNICERGISELLEWERGISKENEQNALYKSKRLIYLESLLSKFPHNMENISLLIESIK